MTPFSSTSSTHLGRVLPPDFLRLMVQNERRKAFEAPPKEREQHFEQANKWNDMLSAYNLMKFGARFGN